MAFHISGATHHHRGTVATLMTRRKNPAAAECL
jgi:hypothetical protein